MCGYVEYSERVTQYSINKKNLDKMGTEKHTYRTAHPAQHAVHAHDDAHEDHSHQHKVDVLQVLFRPRAGCVLIHKWVYTVSIARTYF